MEKGYGSTQGIMSECELAPLPLNPVESKHLQAHFLLSEKGIYLMRECTCLVTRCFGSPAAFSRDRKLAKIALTHDQFHEGF